MSDPRLESETSVRAEASLFASSFLVFAFVGCMSWVFFHGRMAWPEFVGVPEPFQRFSNWLAVAFVLFYLPLRLVSQFLRHPLPRSTSRSRFRLLMAITAAATAVANYVYDALGS